MTSAAAISDLTESESEYAGTMIADITQTTISVAKAAAIREIFQWGLLEVNLEMNSAERMIAAGTEGSMYPGSLDPENEKNTSGTIIHAYAKRINGEKTVPEAPILFFSANFVNKPRPDLHTAAKKNGSQGMVINGSTQKKK